jgi:hypothetical protein
MRELINFCYDIIVMIVLFLMFCTFLIIITPIMIPLLFIVGFIIFISLLIDLFYGNNNKR